MTTDIAVKVDDELLREAREEADARGISIDEALTLALEDWLRSCRPAAAAETSATSPTPFKFPDFWEGEPPKLRPGIPENATYRELLEIMDSTDE